MVLRRCAPASTPEAGGYIGRFGWVTNVTNLTSKRLSLRTRTDQRIDNRLIYAQQGADAADGELS